MSYERFQREELILRDELALDRTRLANERTLLAYARTGLMLLVAGATAIKFFGDSRLAIGAGWTMVVLGLLVGGLGAWRFAAMSKALRRIGAQVDRERTCLADLPEE